MKKCREKTERGEETDGTEGEMIFCEKVFLRNCWAVF